MFNYLKSFMHVFRFYLPIFVIHISMSEYWIREDGYVDFADGDIGDRNHESVVIDQVQSSIVDRCKQLFNSVTSVDYDGGIDWEGFKEEVIAAYVEELTAANPARAAWYEEMMENEPERVLLAALRKAGIKRNEWTVANGQSDARDYAMLHWGWKTYRDGYIDTWRFTRKDVQAIIMGIEEIADDSGWSDRKLARESFGITVFSSNRRFNLTLAQMKRWLERPTGALPSPQFDYLTSQATKQVRDIDLQGIHPAYKRPGVNPFGDSVLSFQAFVEYLDKTTGFG